MNGDLILIIPVLLIIVAIMYLVRHMRGGTDDSIAALIGIVPIVIIIGVAIGIIVSMASIADPWEWDADSKTLTIDGNIHDTGLSYPWTGYADRVESLVIEPGVEFVQGPAFARMTNLEYVDIAEGVTLDDGAFAQTFKDPFDADIAMSDVAGYEYVANEGVMYQYDPSLFTYNNTTVSSLDVSAASAVNLVIPTEHGGIMMKNIGQNAFKNNTTIIRVLHLPDSQLTTIVQEAFYGCASLTALDLPDTVTNIQSQSLRGCTSLARFEFPGSLETIGPNAFRDTSLKSAILPDGTLEIKGYAFNSVTTLEGIYLPASITKIDEAAFSGCTGVTSVSFGSGFAPTLGNNCFYTWTFYAADGTTTIDKTDASALAGKTFQGTAAALVEVAPGAFSLSPEQIQQVRLHDAELERIKLEAISIGPLPFELQDA